VWAFPDTVWLGRAGKVSDVGQVVDGRWIVVPGEGLKFDSTSVGYDRLVAVGDMNWNADYEVLVPFTVHAASFEKPTGVGIVAGWQGHTGDDQPRTYAPFGALVWVRDVATRPRLVIERPDFELTACYPEFRDNTSYLLRVRMQPAGNGITRVRAKLWREGAREPGMWDLIAEVPNHKGSVLLVAHRVEATFGSSLHPLVISERTGGDLVWYVRFGLPIALLACCGFVLARLVQRFQKTARISVNDAAAPDAREEL